MPPIPPYEHDEDYEAGGKYAVARRADRQHTRRAVDWGINGSILAILVLTVIYVFLPIDAVPDFLPVAGQADDLATLVAGGGSVAFLSVLRYILRFVLRSRAGRWGCLLVTALAAIGACTVFWALLRLIDSVF